MDQIRALQIIALKEVLSKTPSSDFQTRMVCRWYSKTFHTPLHIVESLPEFDVLQAYFEDQYETLNDSNEGQAQIQKLLEDLSKTDEELALAAKEQDIEDVWFYQEQKAAISQENGKSKTVITKNSKIAKAKLERDKKTAKELELLQNKDPLGTKIGAIQPEKADAPGINDIDNFEMNFEGLDLDFDKLEGNIGLTGVK
jgi:hypothetical protein